MRVLVGREGESAPARELCWDGVRPLVVGRSHRADVAIDDPLLSRQHCRLEARAGGIFVVDLGSANGTYVNGVRCAEARLGPGDELRLGGSWLRLLAEEGAAPASRRAAVSSNTPTGELPALQPPSHQGGGDATLRAPKLPGYRIERILGRGSFGTVYLGRELDGGGREVAIKVLPAGPRVQPEVVARFLREIETLRRLDHPNLVRIYDAGEAEECLYLVMEYVRGSTLASLLRGGPLPVERVLAIADQLLAGLAHAHAQGFVHRDIKPENVLLDEQGRVRLCDFGLVKAVSADAGDGLTRPGEGLGSVAYMAPEQVRAAHAADARADVYAVGSTLYHMLTGRKPYSGPVTAQLLRDVVSTPPPPLRELAPGVPAELAAIVERCMAKDPELRWQSVAELRAALQAFAARSHGGPGLVGRPPGLHARTVAGLPAFEPEQERGEREGEPAGAARAGAPGAAAGAGGARGRTVVGVPVFEGEPEEEPGAGGRAGPRADGVRPAGVRAGAGAGRAGGRAGGCGAGGCAGGGSWGRRGARSHGGGGAGVRGGAGGRAGGGGRAGPRADGVRPAGVRAGAGAGRAGGRAGGCGAGGCAGGGSWGWRGARSHGGGGAGVRGGAGGGAGGGGARRAAGGRCSACRRSSRSRSGASGRASRRVRRGRVRRGRQLGPAGRAVARWWGCRCSRGSRRKSRGRGARRAAGGRCSACRRSSRSRSNRRAVRRSRPPPGNAKAPRNGARMRRGATSCCSSSRRTSSPRHPRRTARPSARACGARRPSSCRRTRRRPMRAVARRRLRVERRAAASLRGRRRRPRPSAGRRTACAPPGPSSWRCRRRRPAAPPQPRPGRRPRHHHLAPRAPR
ncbi:MAG: hypothetical protein KatS3mg102_2045 [Planctomycetota bacterium]|nr:MAG: hypothetical protein KatS3mg102_2045 [Planctomycetota bacterium]